MTRTTLAVAADYADALLVARRSKNLLFLLLLLVLLLQVTVFALYHFNAFGVVSNTNAASSSVVSVTPAAAPSTGSDQTPVGQPVSLHGFEITLELYRWALSVTSFLGVTLIIVLAVVLLLTAVIMLVGRLIGVSHVTSAFVWCVFLAVILFPWQSLLNSRSGSGDDQYKLTAPARPDQRLPGVLTTWPEMERDSRFESKPVNAEVVLHWMRFAGWPGIAILLLIVVQSKASTGLRFALGEAEIPVELNSVRPNETAI